MHSDKKDIHSKSEMKASKKKLKKDNEDDLSDKRSHSNIRNDLNEEDKKCDEEEEEEQYPIEKIITRRFQRKTKIIEYFVKWQGYDYSESTWETMQNLIEDNCFEKLFDYENQSLDEKIELLNKFKKLKKLKNVTEEIIRETEYCEEMNYFRENYQDFNPIFKAKLDAWEFGNLNDDIVDYIIPCQRTR